MSYKIEVEREVDGRWIAEVPSLPGVLAYGKTKQLALARVKALALRVIADRIERGTRLTKTESPVTTPSTFSFALR
ncbi:MAG: type II toxin-antitoxin system HicB family antitoxin [Acidobacteria bacterium]|nr:type II toxin-antitoxin system HicB family antitoxin [Acidobacteriota bacterium]